MILVSRLNGTQVYINAELVQSIESTPDTVITLTNNVKMIVKERAEQVVDRMLDYHWKLRQTLPVEDLPIQRPGE